MPTQNDRNAANIWARTNTEELIRRAEEQIALHENQLMILKAELAKMVVHKSVFDAETSPST